MEQNRTQNTERIFEKCKVFCQNCGKCKQKTAIMPQKSVYSTKENNQKVFTKEEICFSVNELFSYARETGDGLSTQKKRVKFFYVALTFLEEFCSGTELEEARKLLEREWMRVILYTHSALPNLCKIIEDLLDERALAQTLGLGLNRFNESTYKQAEQMLDFLSRKACLLELYERGERLIRALEPDEKEIAKLRFFERLSLPECINALKLSRRTIQRRTDKLLDHMIDLSRATHNLTPEKMMEFGEREPWILEWFRP